MASRRFRRATRAAHSDEAEAALALHMLEIKRNCFPDARSNWLPSQISPTRFLNWLNSAVRESLRLRAIAPSRAEDWRTSSAEIFVDRVVCERSLIWLLNSCETRAACEA